VRREHPRQAKPPGHLLRRVAERFPSAATRERILFPLLADLQFEHARTEGAVARFRVRLRWMLAFWQALGLETLRASERHLRANAWGTTDLEREAAQRLLPRVAWVTAGVILVLVAEHIPRNAFWLRRLTTAELIQFVLLLAPPGLCMAIPAGLLFGVVLAAKDRPPARPRWRSLLGIATLAGLVTFAIAALITPTANQKHRLLVFRKAAPSAPMLAHALALQMEPAVAEPRALARGDREMGLGELNERAAQLRATGRPGEAVPLEVEWQKKPALGASCMALALAGAAIAWRIGGGRSTWLRAALALARWLVAVIVLAGWYALLRIGEEAGDLGAIAPAVAMWGPSLVVAVLALCALGRRRRKNPAANTA
jgi:lipopolysaccharide export LptBFGC system permease protein LptF